MDSLDELKSKIDKFNKARDWDQFHTPANLAKSIVLEAAELLECFQWNEEDYDLERIKDELADVFNYAIQMAMVLDLDIKSIIEKKMAKNAKKYPVAKSKGKSLKYDELDLDSNDEKVKKVVVKKVEPKEEKKSVLSKVLTKKATVDKTKKDKEEKVIEEPVKEKTKKNSKLTETEKALMKIENETKKNEPKLKNIKGYSAYDSVQDKKFYYEITRKTLIRNDKVYRDHTKKKLIGELIDYYNSMNVINYVLSEEELIFLKVNGVKTGNASDPTFNFLKDLMLFTEKDKKVAITDELIPAIGEALNDYKERKNEIEAKKENAYLLVGIMRVFGALSNSEINRILSKYTDEEIGNFFELPYAVRHIEYRDEYGTSYFALRDLGLDGLSLVETHPENLKCSYTKRELIGIGKAYFNIHSSEYKNLAKDPKCIALLQRIDKEELIRAAGRGEELKVHIMEFYSAKDITEKERSMAYNLVKTLPKYLD